MPHLGLLSDPDFPDQVARFLARILPERLGEQLDARHEWSVEVVCDPVAAGRSSGAEILRAAHEQRQQHGWDYAVCVTDLPLRFDGAPVLADVGIDKDVGVVSLPALGAVQPYRRARQMVVQVLDEMTGATEEAHEQQRTQRRRGLHSRLTELLAPIRRENPDRDEIGVRYRATRKRGRLRLLSGMVRSNTPWRLVLGMSGALAASVATSAFGLVSSVVWQIGDVLDPWRRALVLLGVITLMTTWLVGAHNLWEKPRQVQDREQRVLYNTSTAVTVAVGVVCLYMALFVINLAAGLFLIDPSLLAGTLGHPIGLLDYLDLAWATTSMGVAAGALGSGLEDDATVRQAAYGYRESQRRRTEQQQQHVEEEQ